MIRLLQWLIFGHCHKWKIINNAKIVDESVDKYAVGHCYTLQCESCGDLKRRRINN